mmetsp:Transcript_22607/g.28854  ORF Transcript_22607/g.28854 Transcript_22607/m.28854 type:complete len:358 (+) Transcript_22607:40-1113(+)
MGGGKSKEEKSSPEPETLSQKSFQCYIKCLNWCILLGSISLFVVSIIVAARFPISGGSGNFVKFGPMIISFFTAIYSIMALRGNVTKQSTRICYFVTVVIASFIITIAGIIAIMFVYYSEKSATQTSTELPKGSGSTMMIQSNDYSMATWNECCAKDSSYNLTAVVACIPNSITCPQSQGAWVYGCACIQDPETYQLIFDEITGSMCKNLRKRKVDFEGQRTVYIVGPPEDNGCGMGHPKQFQLVMYKSIEQGFKPLGITYCIVGSVLFFGALVAFCCAMGNKSDAADEKEEKEKMVEMKGNETKKDKSIKADQQRMAYDSLEEDTGYYEDDGDEGANPFVEGGQPLQEGDGQLAMA